MPAIDSSGLRKALDKSNYTTKQLADDLGISIQYMCDILSGHRTLKRNPELRHNIAKKLDVPYNWIETGSEAVAS